MTNKTGAVYWAHKLATASILAVGAYFNVTALFFGMDLVAATFFTTTGETILTAWFFAAFVTGILAELYAPLENRVLRIVRRLVTFYMFMLTLAHGVNNLLLDNVEAYTRIFSGPVYTYTAIVVLIGLAIVTASLPPPRVDRSVAPLARA